MIHHVKQKMWLNLNANAVAASVHSNVNPTMANDPARVFVRQACWAIAELPSRFTVHTCFCHPSPQTPPGCYFPHQVGDSLGPPPASNHHVTVPR